MTTAFLARRRVLQVNPAASRETLARAASRLAGVAPDPGYSPAALHSRAVVLKAAVDFLSDPARRRSYDKRHAVGQPQVQCQQFAHRHATRCLFDGLPRTAWQINDYHTAHLGSG